MVLTYFIIIKKIWCSPLFFGNRFIFLCIPSRDIFIPAWLLYCWFSPFKVSVFFALSRILFISYACLYNYMRFSPTLKWNLHAKIREDFAQTIDQSILNTGCNLQQRGNSIKLINLNRRNNKQISSIPLYKSTSQTSS